MAPDTPQGASGFTLLEVIVALAIAALALVGLFQTGSAGLFAASTAARMDEAVERAQSHLAAFAQSGVLAAGVLTGEDGDGYRWKLRAKPIAQRAAVRQPAVAGAVGVNSGTASESLAPLALYEVEVTISWRSGRQERSVVLETRRLGPVPASE